MDLRQKLTKEKDSPPHHPPLINLKLYPSTLFQIISFQLRQEISGTKQFGFSPSEGFSSVSWRAKGPALSTSANVNTAIPSQLETLNALDSVHYQGWSVQLMQPWSPLAASDGWDG